MRYKLIILFLFTIYLEAKTYTLYISSSKYLEVTKKYFYEIKSLFPNDDLIIRTHLKSNYSLIIRNITNIEKAKELQKKLIQNTTYKDCYIKKYENEPLYNIILAKEKPQQKINIESSKDYIHEVESSNEYITASTMYNIKNYLKAYELFYELFKKNSFNININYFLAKSAIKIRKFDEASAAFERILIEKPDFNQVRYEYAKLLYNLKLKEEAKKEFIILSKAEVTEDTKKLVSKYLDILNTKTKYSFINASILIGAGRSSNVNNGLISSEYILPGLNDIIVTGDKPIADNFHNEILALSFSNFFKNHPKYKLKNSFILFNKSYLNEKDENTTVFAYKPSISYFDKDNKNVYSLELGLNKIDKKNNESFYALNILPSLSNKLFYSSFNYQRILYLNDENKEKNFDKYELIFKYNLIEKLTLYSKLTKNIRNNSTRIDLDKLSYAGGLEYVYSINNENSIKLGLEYIYSKYKYENSFFESKREDDNYFISLSYLTNIDKLSQLMFVSSFVKNDSNQDAYVYKELEGKVNYIKSFNW